MGMETKEIAKLVRAEIKKMHTGIKISVIVKGNSIIANIISAPFPKYSKARQKWVEAGCPFTFEMWISEEGIRYYDLQFSEMEELIKSIRNIMEQYIFSDCDGQIDYFNCNFYPSVSVCPNFKQI